MTGRAKTARALACAADRHRYQAAHVLPRRVLSGHTGLAPGQLAFGRERCPGCGRSPTDSARVITLGSRCGR